ncbi:hypothetical protein V1525DRAFT_408283 [Lipomyces kononenkoae]|uniref:Uncharacterized protein n=1 Tax=Lipomyces kononenkoae TaxID=34357 RepID=A0ACC3SWH7_LIPKO
MGHGARYPAWCMSYFWFAFLQALFAIIPLCVVAYFIGLIRRHNRHGGVPPPYVILITVTTITSVVILLSTVAIIYRFRNAAYDDSNLRNDDECELEDESDFEVGRGTIDIDVQAPGYLWPFAFVASQVSMTFMWIGIFVYIMLLSGGISTSCTIPHADKWCTGRYEQTCHSYVTVCHLGNLLVVSCALEACLWISGTISMFINSAITYRKRSILGFYSVAQLFSSRRHTTSRTSRATSTVRSTNHLNSSSRIVSGTQSFPSAFWRPKRNASSDSMGDNTIYLQCMRNSTMEAANRMNTVTYDSAGCVADHANPFEDTSDGDVIRAPTAAYPQASNGSNHAFGAGSILSHSHRHEVMPTSHRRPSSSWYVQVHEPVDPGGQDPVEFAAKTIVS